MHKIAQYLINNRAQAALAVALLFSLGPFARLFSSALHALVCLRRGPKEGLLNLLLSGALASALLYQFTGSLFASVVSVMSGLLPTWLLAVLLRETISLQITLEIAGYVSLALVGFLFYFSNLESNITEHFEQALNQAFASLEKAPTLPDLDALPVLGFFMAGLLLTQVASLFFARYWQAALFNPGGFKQEFHALKLGQNFALVVLILLGISVLPAEKLELSNQLSVVGLSLFFISGLSLMHYLVSVRKMNTTWLVTGYLLMALLPHVILLVAFFGIADSWFNFRRRWHTPAQ
jgi:Predicted membrane protein (DUF2232)